MTSVLYCNKYALNGFSLIDLSIVLNVIIATLYKHVTTFPKHYKICRMSSFIRVVAQENQVSVAYLTLYP